MHVACSCSQASLRWKDKRRRCGIGSDNHRSSCRRRNGRNKRCPLFVCIKTSDYYSMDFISLCTEFSSLLSLKASRPPLVTAREWQVPKFGRPPLHPLSPNSTRTLGPDHLLALWSILWLLSLKPSSKVRLHPLSRPLRTPQRPRRT